jgi:type IV pilus secretin PilQ/predicted competence protein
LLLLMFGLVAPGVAGAETTPSPARLNDVTVERAPDGATVVVKTTGPVTYEASLIDSPTRLVIDLTGTIFAWPKTRMNPDVAPIREIRGSQFKVGVARVVVELTRRSGYRIDQGPDGLVIAIEPSATAKAAPKPEASAARKAETAPPEVVKGGVPAAKKSESAPAVAEKKANASDPAKTAAATPSVTKPEATASAKPAPAPKKPEPATAKKLEAPDPTKTVALAPKSDLVSEPPQSEARRETRAAEKLAGAKKPEPLLLAPPPIPPSVAIGQAQPTPAPPAPRTNGSKLISLDFKDADVINLLRIVAAESGKNIVAGDDVKGRVSISLRNVTPEQALDTILEVRGLAKIEKEGVIRVVSLDQLTKEREAQARVEDAKRRAEIETRTKLAEAQLKEADLASKRAASIAAEEEARARGPLREETVRLSYADPEEVARTLQGILGIPPEGMQPVSSTLPASPYVVPSGGSPPIAEPPFAQLYGSGAGPRQPALVSVSQDVLAKGITIKAHKPTNTIFIRHYQADLERIKRLIREQLDVPLPQVKIEARMEILDRNALEAIGIQWGGAGAGNFANSTLVGQGFQSTTGRIPGAVLPTQGGVLQADGSTVIVNPVSPTITPNNPTLNLSRLLPVDASTGLPMGGNLVNLPFQLLPNAASAIPAGGIAFGIVGTRFNINLALQALATQGKTRTLARPDIVTVENAKASISLGEEIPYATVSSAGTQIQFKEALLKLEVTPTVIRERVNEEEIRKIKMVVIVENNSRGDPVNLGAGGTPPAINRRKAETQVLIREGERLVIGGVTQGVTQSTVRKVPVLGDIPIFGWLFKQRENFETGRELVVFVTPSILRTEGAVAAK